MAPRAKAKSVLRAPTTTRANQVQPSPVLVGRDHAGTIFNQGLMYALSHACDCYACEQLRELAPILATILPPATTPIQE